MLTVLKSKVSKRKTQASVKKSGQATKSLWWIPRHTEAKKDVATDETFRGAGSKR